MTRRRFGYLNVEYAVYRFESVASAHARGASRYLDVAHPVSRNTGWGS